MCWLVVGGPVFNRYKLTRNPCCTAKRAEPVMAFGQISGKTVNIKTKNRPAYCVAAINLGDIFNFF